MDTFLNFFARFLSHFWEICADMGFWMLFGFVLAGLAGQWIPLSLVKRHLSGGGWRSVVKAVLIGVPLPLCSCGVLPVAAELRKAGASKGAVAAFTATTPQTGIESVSVSWSLMGLPFTAARVFADIVAGVFAGCLIDHWSALKTPRLGECPECADDDTHPHPRSVREKWRAGLREGLIDLPADIGRYVLAGILVGAALTAAFPTSALAPYVGNVWVGYVVATLFALPLFVCSTGSVPIAFALVAIGFSPGAAIIFLVFGPSTNPSAIAVLWRILGRRAGAIYLAALAASAWVMAIVFDSLGGRLGDAAAMHAHEAGLFGDIFAAAMLVVFALAFVVRGKEGCRCHLHKGHHHENL